MFKFKKLRDIKGPDGKPVYQYKDMFVSMSSTGYISESYIWLEFKGKKLIQLTAGSLKDIKQRPEFYRELLAAELMQKQLLDKV